jgi:hypothetical protein
MEIAMAVKLEDMSDEELWAATKEIAEHMIQRGEKLKALAEGRAPPGDAEARRQFICIS